MGWKGHLKKASKASLAHMEILESGGLDINQDSQINQSSEGVGGILYELNVQAMRMGMRHFCVS